MRFMRFDKLDSAFLQYIVDNQLEADAPLPTLSNISKELDVSVGKLREEVGSARTLGVVSIKPRVGMRRMAYDFKPAIVPSILFGLATGEANFRQLSELRRGVESSLWPTAVKLLHEEDITELREIVASAWRKLKSERIIIPHQEHRLLHLQMYKRLDNPFVVGLLEAYWDVYEASEFGRYQSYSYWHDVWTYHDQIVELIAIGDIEQGLQCLIDHFNLLKTTPETARTNGQV